MARGGKREGAGRKPGSVSRLDAEARQRASAGGMMPLDYLLQIMRDESEDTSARRDAAKAAAPYCHARLSATEISGPNGGDIPLPETTNTLDVSDLSVDELEVLYRVLKKAVG